VVVVDGAISGQIVGANVRAAPGDVYTLRGVSRPIRRADLQKAEVDVNEGIRLLLLAGAIALIQAAPAGQGTQRLFVSVVNAAGVPVTDLAASDFSVTENGVARTVTRATLASDPMRIALVVDSGDAVAQPIGEFRDGLTAFVDGLPEGTEMGFISTGRQARIRLQPTADRQKQREITSGFFGDGAGTAILDGMLEAQRRFFAKVENRWLVIVVVTTDGAGAGNLRDDTYNRFIAEMSQSGIVIHAVVLSTRGGGIPTVFALNATSATGGRYEAIAASTALPSKLRELAAQLSAQFQSARTQYKIEYVSDLKDRAVVKAGVGVARSGVKVAIASRLPVKS
jgi:hypothetical protein